MTKKANLVEKMRKKYNTTRVSEVLWGQMHMNALQRRRVWVPSLVHVNDATDDDQRSTPCAKKHPAIDKGPT